MAESGIHIDRLHLDLRGVAPDVASAAISTLGPALQQAIAARLAGGTSGTAARIDRVATPPVRIPAGADAATLCRAVAGQVGNAVAAQVVTPQPGRA